MPTGACRPCSISPPEFATWSAAADRRRLRRSTAPAGSSSRPSSRRWSGPSRRPGSGCATWKTWGPRWGWAPSSGGCWPRRCRAWPTVWSASRRDPDGAAVVLFTSGTEGSPKGVVLSHVNLQANRYQVASMIDFGPQDIVFNVLPLFHSFGLTCGTLLPLLSGIKVFLYPSPLHYRIIPELVYDTNATLYVRHRYLSVRLRPLRQPLRLLQHPLRLHRCGEAQGRDPQRPTASASGCGCSRATAPPRPPRCWP